jgi:hypothetical protein
VYIEYPAQRPPGNVNLGPEWWNEPFYPQTLSRLFPQHVLAPHPWHFLEIGSFVGRSCIGLLKLFPRAIITCVDIWRSFPRDVDNSVYIKEFDDPESQFFINTWDHRERIRVVKLPSYQAMEFLWTHGSPDGSDYCPDIIYHDGNHTSNVVERDVLFASRLWPKAQQIGDDWENFPAVLVGATKAAQVLSRRVEITGPFWCLR